MRPNYINNWSLWLPSKFHKLHPIKHSCEVILQVSNGRTCGISLFDVVIFRSGEGSKCTNDGEQTAPTMEETDNEEGDSSDDSSDDFGDDSSDDSVKMVFLRKKGGGGTSSTRRFQKQTPGRCIHRLKVIMKMMIQLKSWMIFHLAQIQRRVL
ncbi:unnamed protein product [Prunus brigantina]